MVLLLVSVLLPTIGALAAFCFRRRRKLTDVIGAGSVVIGACAGLFPVLRHLVWFGGGADGFSCFGIDFRLDVLSAIFLLPILILSPLCALHAVNYVHDVRRKGEFWLFFNVMCSALLLVPLAGWGTPVFFLAAWELMGFSSFLLVAFERGSADVCRSGWIYFLSVNAGAALLIPMFILGGSPFGAEWRTAIFLLALTGFGLKIGLAGLHVWLPSAHSAAPAPVSAMMSAAMNNLGFYGILRTMEMWTGIESAFGWWLLIPGVVGSCGAMLFGLAQTHVKRLAAYSSVENFSIAAIGFGLGMLLLTNGLTAAAVAAFGGAFLHLWNHSMLKGALFLCCGSLHIGCGTYRMEKLGGVLKKMPFTGGVFMFAASAISGLPPFNAFLSEFLIYFAAFSGLVGGGAVLSAASLTAVLALALTGGLAVAGFTKASGMIFLGEPRSDLAVNAAESPWQTKTALAVLSAAAVFLMFCGGWAVGLFVPAIAELTGIGNNFDFKIPAFAVLTRIGMFGGLAAVLFMLFSAVRLWLLRGKKVDEGPTWDCGYIAPDARMEYSPASFSRPLEIFFNGILRCGETLTEPDGLYPRRGQRVHSLRDAAERWIFEPLFHMVEKLAVRAHRLQSGYLHLYILIMAVTIIAMLVWAFGVPCGDWRAE